MSDNNLKFPRSNKIAAVQKELLLQICGKMTYTYYDITLKEHAITQWTGTHTETLHWCKNTALQKYCIQLHFLLRT